MGKKKKNTNVKKNMVGRNIKTRNWIEIFVLCSIVSLIFVNSLYLDGFDCSEITYDSGSLVAGSDGYQIDGNVFQYLGEDNTYVQIIGGEEIQELLFSFQNAPEKDVDAEIFYLDGAGNVLDTTSRCIWKKGKSYMKAEVEEGTYNSFLVSIPADFTLSKVYYAASNSVSSGKRIGIAFAMLFFSAVLTSILMCFEPVRKIVHESEKKVIFLANYLREHFKKIGLFVLVYVVIVSISTVILNLLAKKKSFTVSGHLLILILGAGLMLTLMLVCYRLFSKKLEVMGAIAILATGAMFAFAEPANVGVSWDDEVHYNHAIQLSHLFDSYISVSDQTVINDYVSVATEKRNYSRQEQKRYNELLDVLEKSNYYTEKSGESFGVASVAYLPSALGLLIARGLGIPFHIMLIIGRWMNTWLLAVLCYFAMKQLKTGKIVVLLIAMLPTNLFLAANYTYDTWLTSWSILGLSAFFGEWQRPNEKISTEKQWLIAISMYLAVLPKQVYFPLTCIALFMPLSKFSNQKACWRYRCLIACAVLFPFLTVYIQNFMGEGMGKGDVRGGEAVDAASQLEFIKNNPSQAGKILYNYLKGYLNPFTQGGEYTTKLAYMGYIPVDYRYILGTMVVGALISREETEPVKFPWWSKLGALFVYLVIGTVAAVSMYVAFTPVGLETVNGCQGRYLLPALFPVLYLWSRFSCKTYIRNLVKETNIHIILIALATAVSIWGVWSCCVAYY